jgi:hypothetical protein
MTALGRTSRAWRWVISIWLGELVIAAVAAYGIRSHVSAAMDEFVIPDDHRLYAMAEFAHAHPQLLVSMAIGLVTSALLGWVIWSVLAPLVLLRLSGTEAAGELGRAWLGRLGPAIATSAWHLGIRVGAIVLGAQALAILPGLVAGLLLLVVVPLVTCALDLSRVAVVLEGAPGGAVRTALDGFARLIREPRRTAAMAGLAALQWVLVLAGLVVLVRSGAGALPVMRASAAAAAFFGVWRLALAAAAAPRAASRAASGE